MQDLQVNPPCSEGVNTFGVSVRVYRDLKSHIELLILCHFATPYSSADCVRELSKDSASHLICTDKKFRVFFVGDVISGMGFWPFWLRLPGPGPSCQMGIISLKILLETRRTSRSFEPLIGFLAFLVQVLG